MSDSDSGERTERATPQRMQEARRKGQLSTSRDLPAWLGIAAAALMMPLVLPAVRDATAQALLVVPSVVRDPDLGVAVDAMMSAFGAIGPALLPLLVAVAIVVIGGFVAQGGIHVRRLTPRLESLDLVTGLGRVFGRHALWEGLKALVKTLLVGGLLYLVVQTLLPLMDQAGGLPLSSLLAGASGGLWLLLLCGIGAGLALAGADVFVVMRRNRRFTRMTKKELRDEAKRTEGDPVIRSQRRSRQLALSRNRMIAGVADADVVLLNPTHLTVALVYEPGVSAPRVVAKGAGEIGARIREEAAEHGVPMVRDVPLARSLYHSCEIGQEIPAALYLAVARVLAFVMALRSRGAARGTHDFDSASPELERR